MSETNTFRSEVASWLAENCPEGARGPGQIANGSSKITLEPDTALWLERMAERGWTAPTWPTEYGGGGLTTAQAKILYDEMAAIGARSPLMGMGTSMIGPTLLEYGTEEQKQRHLPKIARGEYQWCQGYSEPNAGSDLAALTTRAVDNGDHYVINGQKIWTSGAATADWMFILVRTDPDAPKHEGISFMLMSMDQEGVTTKPIRLISGSSPFCETFLDDAIASKDDLVGELNKGWSIGKRLLQFERSGIGGLTGGARAADPAKTMVKVAKKYIGEEDGKIADPAMRDTILDMNMRRAAFGYTAQRANEENKSGTPGAATSIFKLVGAGLQRDGADLKRQLMGFRGLGAHEEVGFTADELKATEEFLHLRTTTIYGGSNEVQLNIISKRVLGLPDQSLKKTRDPFFSSRAKRWQRTFSTQLWARLTSWRASRLLADLLRHSTPTNRSEPDMKQQAPYGAWPSPVSADLIVSQMIGVGGACLVAGDLYWQESRPQEGGRTTLLRRGPNGVTEELTPPPFNVRTRVHEYGGGAWVVLPEKIIFSNFADQQLYVATPGKKPEVLTHAPALRFANGVFDQPRNRIICVVEDHGGDGEPSNYLGGIDLDSGNLVKLTEGHDFYSSPTLSADGSRLAWITWDHPDMPWDTTTLWEATLAEGDLQNITVVAGGKNEAVQQPRYDNAGKLHYISDQNGWWNLYQFHQGKSQCLCEKQAEFGVPPWVFGQSTYTFTDNGIVCVYAEKNEHRLARLVDGNLTDIDTPFTAINGVSVAGNLLATTCASATEFPSIVLFDLQTHSMENVKKSGEIDIDPDCYSIPRSIEFATADNDTAHGFFYPPTNKDFQAPADELPPLIVILHGGPTAATHPVLSLGTQYWTSRGFAVLDVNYRGSTGYGRAYRQKLNRRWGIADVDDTVFGATHLADEGLVDRNRMAIRGGSAGGYTTLAALTFRDTFKAGASHYGIGDLEALLRDTHKFESRYPDSLVGAYPQDIDVYKARSPINHVEQLTCPVIFFQGLEDRIVPPNQAQAMVDALTDSGIPVAYVPFAGEQHGFRKAENIKRALELELYFYARIFDFDPADDIEGIPIVNLD